MTTQTPQLLTFIDAERVLAQTLPGYTERPQQQDLAAAVESVILSARDGEAYQLLGQAGCGVGKSLAYLIPAILSGKRIIVATSTKALQEQIAGKDMPFLQDHLGVPFSYTVLKGRSNYLCEEKASNVTIMDVPSLAELRAEIEQGASGDREHFAATISPREWGRLSSSANDCLGKSDCPFGETCHAERAKDLAREADIVITNTSMLMLDLRLRQITDDEVKMLGDYDLVIIDEAHELPEIATNALSEELRSSQFDRLANDAHVFASTQDTEVSASQSVQGAVAALWMELQFALDAQNRQRAEDTFQLSHSWVIEREELFFGLIAALKDLHGQLGNVDIVRGGDQSSRQRKRLRKRAYNMIGKLTGMLVSPDEETVRWIEVDKRFVRGRENTDLLLKSSPINVSGFLRANLWNAPVIMVSATLAAGGDFSYIVDALGLDEPLTINVGTPFNYRTQARLFVPPASAPSPKDRNTWETYAQTTMLELVRAAKGGALLLFTSTSAMRAARQLIGPMLEGMGLTVLMQGDAPNRQLAQVFKDDTHSVLFALKSFFVGVDFVGETCRLVVIDKLPFPVPSDILFAARSQAVERKYGARSSFGKLSIPMMVLTLNQGFGRLIRSLDDRGVVAILDSRLSSTGYGKSIVKKLPPAPVVTDIAAVKEFYAS
jgi:ATP-dependent DNA helicase DinG